jgi:hypothetical protein
MPPKKGASNDPSRARIMNAFCGGVIVATKRVEAAYGPAGHRLKEAPGCPDLVNTSGS